MGENYVCLDFDHFFNPSSTQQSSPHIAQKYAPEKKARIHRLPPTPAP